MFPVIDMHCDTILSIYCAKRQGREVRLRENGLHVDLARMRKAGYLCQSFALFVNLEVVLGRGEDPSAYAKALSDLLDAELAANADWIRPVRTASEILQNRKEGFLSALKTIEEGGVYLGSPELVRTFYGLGVRKSTLTWNYENELAFPNRHVADPATGRKEVSPETERGLKPAGEEIVLLMEDLGMLLDVSHLGDAGIWDVLRIVRRDTPVIASHSNARSVTGHPRNLTDEMLRAIADHGGITGINFCPAFLCDDGKETSRVSDMVRHIRHIRNVAGIDAIGLGSDFDGIRGDLELNGAGDMQKLAGALSAAGFPDGEIEKIFWKNALRVYQAVLG